MATSAWLVLHYHNVLPKSLVLLCASWLPYTPHPNLDPLVMLLQATETNIQYWNVGSVGSKIGIIGWAQRGQTSFTTHSTSRAHRSGIRYGDKRVIAKLVAFRPLLITASIYNDLYLCGSVAGMQYLGNCTVTIPVFNSDPQYILLSIAYGGSVPLLQQYCKSQNISNRLLRFSHYSMLHQAMVRGHVAMVEYLHLRLKLRKAMFQASSTIKYWLIDNGHLNTTHYNRYNWSVIEAAAAGHLDMIRYLHQHVGFTSSDLGNTSSSYIYLTTNARISTPRTGVLNEAIAHDRLSIVRYLHQEVRLKLVDFRFHINRGLRIIIRLGLLRMVEYLHQVIGLSARDFTRLKFNPIAHAIINGHVELIEYLHSKVGLSVEFFISQLRTPALRSCSISMLRGLRKIIGRRHLLEILNCDSLLESCCLPLIRYVHEELGVSGREMAMRCRLKFVLKSGNLELLKYCHIKLETPIRDFVIWGAVELHELIELRRLDIISYLHTNGGFTLADINLSLLTGRLDSNIQFLRSI